MFDGGGADDRVIRMRLLQGPQVRERGVREKVSMMTIFWRKRMKTRLSKRRRRCDDNPVDNCAVI
jgi:hypothetical protein